MAARRGIETKGRRAPSLTSDPRDRRNDATDLSFDQQYAPPFSLDTRGRLAIDIGTGLTIVNGQLTATSQDVTVADIIPAPPSVTGSTGSNEALDNLLTALASLGIIRDNTDA